MSRGQPISTQMVDKGPGSLELDTGELRVATGPDKGAHIELAPHSLRIGTGSDCDLVLHDTTVSAQHAEVLVTSRGYFIRDLGSTNGILVGPWPIERAPLIDGMRLRLGGTVLLVRALGARRSIPLVSPGRFGPMVAHSVKMRALVAQLQQLALSDVTVLLEGETGTGKEVAAQGLHDASPRAPAPFVVFDCGAVNSKLIASELFGHERGAFSGAHTARPGLLEQADGGTLFIDEIGELPLEVQPYLLRAIERRTCRRVGGNVDIALDVRIVSATNRNLAEEVRARRFREDLYFRLAVARLRLPPLRERPEDVPLLGQLLAAEVGTVLSPELLALLSAHDWPGNVRELRNTITRIAVHPETAAQLLRPEQTPTLSSTFIEEGQLRPLLHARRLAADEFERLYLQEALARARGSLSRASELAGVSRQVFTRMAAKYGMRARDRREG